MNLMNNGVINTPEPSNEPILGYGPGSKEKLEIKKSWQLWLLASLKFH